jgi:hypothetical protein
VYKRQVVARSLASGYSSHEPSDFGVHGRIRFSATVRCPLVSHMMKRMSVTFRCADYGHSNRVEAYDTVRQISCSRCGHALAVPGQSIGDGRVDRCVGCRCTDLLVRDDFPRRPGVRRSLCLGSSNQRQTEDPRIRPFPVGPP